MPLFCITLLSLMLLPIALSCNSATTHQQLIVDFPVIETLIRDTEKKLNHNNSNCSVKIKGCASIMDVALRDLVTSIYNMTCKIKHLDLDTNSLVENILQSLGCTCQHEKARRRKRVPPRTTKKPPRKRKCKANLILKSLTRCYHMLNSMPPEK